MKPIPKVPKAVKAPPKPVKPSPKVAKVAKVEAAGKTPAAVPVRGAFEIQLGAVKTKVRGAKEAARLAQAHKSLLSRLTVKAVRANLGKRGIFYRLRAGPLADRAAAAALCAKLKARKQGCIVIKR
jgi:cell division septation protein DedD